jgi:ribosomal protein L7/L12
MGTREVILRPGDSLAIVLDVPGRPMRLELSLTEEGLAVGAPTQRPGPAPKQDADVHSLAAMEAYVEEIIEDDEDSEDIMDQGGLGGEAEEQDALNLNMDELDEEDVAVESDYPLDAEAPPMDEVEDDSGIPSDELVMLPPTGEYAAASDAPIGATMLDLDAAGNPKERFTPNPDDTLPVWKDKASGYRDPNLEKKKKTTGVNAKGKPAALSGFTVFLSPPRGDAKKHAAAKIIADLQGIDMGSALALVGKMIVPVAKDVSEQDANNIRDRFKDAGLSCRVTQKR